MYLIRSRWNVKKWDYTVGTWEPDKNWNEIASTNELEEAMEIASTLNATLKGYSE